jgi:hypothetical protein
MVIDEAVDYFAIDRQSPERRLFVLSHKAAIAIDVGAQDSSELTLQYLPLDDGDSSAAFFLCQIAADRGISSIRKGIVAYCAQCVPLLRTDKMIAP